MFNWIRQNRPAFATINALAALAIAATAAVGTIVQAWVSASQVAALPQVQARSISELRVQIEARRTALQKEIQELEELLKDLSRAEAALTGSPLALPVINLDPWWLSAVKTVAVYFVLALAIAATVFAALVDLVILVFGYDFPLLRAVWKWSWREVTIEWYWQRASAAGVAMGILGLLALYTPVIIREARRQPSSDEAAASDHRN